MHDRALKTRVNTWSRSSKQVVSWVLFSLLTTVLLPSNQIHKLLCNHCEGVLARTDTPCGLHENPPPAELMPAQRRRSHCRNFPSPPRGAALRPYDCEFLLSFKSHVAWGECFSDTAGIMLASWHATGSFRLNPCWKLGHNYWGFHELVNYKIGWFLQTSVYFNWFNFPFALRWFKRSKSIVIKHVLSHKTVILIQERNAPNLVKKSCNLMSALNITHKVFHRSSKVWLMPFLLSSLGVTVPFVPKNNIKIMQTTSPKIQCDIIKPPRQWFCGCTLQIRAVFIKKKIYINVHLVD